MKKLICSFAVMVTLILVTYDISQAQVRALSPSLASDNLTAAGKAKSSAKFEASKAKAEKKFNKKFKTSAEVKWSTDENFIHAYYKEGEITTRIAYNNKGRWFRTIKSYDAANLNKRVANSVKRQFRGYEISSINEVQEGPVHCYFVNIVKGKDFKQVIFYLGEIMVHQEFVLQ